MRSALPHWVARAYRIETGKTASGVADVLVHTRAIHDYGETLWIENKVANKQGDTIEMKEPLKAEQAEFLQYARAAGCAAYVVLWWSVAEWPTKYAPSKWQCYIDSAPGLNMCLSKRRFQVSDMAHQGTLLSAARPLELARAVWDHVKPLRY